MDKGNFSKENFRELIHDIQNIVDDEMSISKINKNVEHVRYLSEFLIYSNRNNLTYFELFIEKKVLDTFSKILDKCNTELNKQLIQTMSILIQNIKEEEESFYLFSHSFLNKLISYNFDLTGNNELIDYFISFLKMLSLRLDRSSIQFFFNPRFKDFPLYGVATSLYNHSEPMVRTAARTITLSIYNIWTKEMLESLLSLPHATYFPNLACQLRKLWKRIDTSLLQELNFDDLRDEIEDINDLLMYFQDIFNAKIPKLTKALANSLLYYAYLPCIIGSLGCTTKDPDITSYSAAIFFLSQTFNYIREPSFTNSLAISLFMPHIPPQYEKWINGPIKVPRSFKDKYTRKTTATNLYKYAEENLSLANINLFINNNWSFLNDVQEEYEELKRLYCNNDSGVMTEEPDDLKRKGIELVANHLNAKQIAQVLRYHTQLSVALGKPIGLMEKEAEYDFMSPTDYTDMILDVMYAGNYNKFIMHHQYHPNENSQTLLNFLRSKDDSLILLIGSLLYTYMNSEAVDPTIHFHSRLYPIGKISVEKPEEIGDEREETKSPRDSNKKLNQNEEEKSIRLNTTRDTDSFNVKVLMTYDGPQYDQEIMWMVLNLLCTDPPFRLITFKFLALITYKLWYHSELQECLHYEEYVKLAHAYVNSIKHIKMLLKNSKVSQCFLEVFDHQWKKFIFHDEAKLSRVVRNPWALVPIYVEKYKDKLPDYLRISETNITQLKDHIQRFLTLGNLIYKFKKTKKMTPFDEYPFKFEGRDVYSWNVGDTIVPDEDKTLVLCHLVEGKYVYSRYIVLDPEFFLLAEPDFDEGPLKTIVLRIKLSLK